MAKNKLQREAEERKAARREAMKGKTKAYKTSRMEVMFQEMMKMSSEDIQKRLEEITVRRQNIEKEVIGRHKKDGQAEQLELLATEDRKLETEEIRLTNFTKVKDQVIKIMEIREGLIEKKALNSAEADKSLESIKRQIRTVEEIDKEIEELDKYSEEFSKKQTITEEDKRENLKNSKRYNELLEEKRTLSDREKELEVAKKRVDAYKNGTSQEDSLINKCNMAWKMLLAWKTWDEISIRAVEELDKRKENIELELAQEPTQEPTQEPIPEPEPTPEPTPESKPKWYQFIKRFKNWNEKRKQEKLEGPEIQPEPEPEPSKRDAFIESLRDKVDPQRQKELQAKRQEMKEVAAIKYATKYGGRYNEQDGADKEIADD